ncbi:hypothetical protein [Thalassiella azotivora]
MLGACVVASMYAAGTGRMESSSSDGTVTTTTYQFVPELRMHAVTPTSEVVVTDTTGWLRTEGHPWVQEAPGAADPRTLLATATIGATRDLVAPQSAAASYAQCTDWVGEGLQPVDGTSDVHRKYRCRTPYEALGVTVSDLTLWLDADHLPVRSTADSAAMGLSTSTVTTFSAWGHPVDIPDPAAG